MEPIPDDLQCASVLLFMLLLLILAFLAGAYLANHGAWTGIFLHDPLTKGMKPIQFQNRVKRLLDKKPAITAALVLLDIEHFQQINHRYEMQLGDEVLCQVCRVLCQHLDANEFVARGEGDSFFLSLLTQDTSLLRSRTNEIQKDIHRQTENPQSVIRLRQGACLVDGTQKNADLLISRAKPALRQYVSGEGCVFYDAALIETVRRGELLNSLFISSSRQHKFQLYLQPKVTLKANQCTHAEALVRWHHPRFGNVCPSAFIPVFERNRYVMELDHYMFEEVCRYLQTHNTAKKGELMISISIPRRHSQDPAFLEEYTETKERYGIADGQAELELTEFVFFNGEQIVLIKRAVSRMYQLGFRCSLGDFSSGFSPLGLLKNFDVDAIKLDRIFFENIAQGKTQDILCCLIELTHRLHAQVVAEGTETEEQLDSPRAATYDMVQDYYYAHPLPAARYTTWLEQFHSVEQLHDAVYKSRGLPAVLPFLTTYRMHSCCTIVISGTCIIKAYNP